MPAMSSSRPMRRSGADAAIESPKASSVAAIIFDLEGARRDGIDGDVLRSEFAGEHARQLVQGRLAAGVGVHGQLADVDPVDAADVDDPGGVVGCACLTQCGQQRLDQPERRLEVEVEHFVPCRVREALQRLAPCRARVVDQDVQSARRRR